MHCKGFSHFFSTKNSVFVILPFTESLTNGIVNFEQLAPGLNSYMYISGSDGLQGPPGHNGQPGLQGQSGNPGSKGAKGEIGSRGDPGVAGGVGPAGANGSRGEDGIKGAKGKPGSMGIQVRINDQETAQSERISHSKK